MLETGVEEEVGVVVKCDILALFNGRTFDDAELNDGRGINWTAITVGYGILAYAEKLPWIVPMSTVDSKLTLHARTTCTSTLRLLENCHLVPEAAVPSSDTM